MLVSSNDGKKNSDDKQIHEHSASSENDSKKRTVLESHGYVLGHTIGTGTYAAVKVAWSTTHNSNVAIKIISKFTAPTDYLRKFLPREIEVVKGLKHPNLIRFIQAIETTHRVYIIMEYAENGSLLDIIRHDTYIDETRSKKWFKQLIEALHYCHEKNVVHRPKFDEYDFENPTVWFRDIKCENMLMDSSYNLKLSDFGFARTQVRKENGQYALSDTFCGSYAYASPEILKGIPYQAHLADVWSCGVVLYAMVFGRLPYDDSNFATLLKQVTGKIHFPREPKVSIRVKNLIMKILVPLKDRVTLAVILNDPWITAKDTPESQQEASTSKVVKSTEAVAAKKSQKSVKSEERVPQKPVTKVSQKVDKDKNHSDPSL